MSLIVRSRIKELVTDMNVAGDFADVLDKKAEELIKVAVERAKANNRKTLMAKDL
ncbi:DUF1931 family protein [Candidatus Woesearchaeota archaeon]|nr:DUF1931 family protein [Candidatus Woesearchaeota archaeon]